MKSDDRGGVLSRHGSSAVPDPLLIGSSSIRSSSQGFDGIARTGRRPTHAPTGSAETPANHRYPDYEGLLTFRTAVANWYRGRFGVTLDPQTEVLTLIGSKEGTAHMPLAFVNPGDVVLVPDPGYPVYAAGTWFAEGDVHFMPLRRANAFLPDLDAIPAEVAKRAKLMYLNYPNNPTAAVATPQFFSNVVDFARRHQIIVCHDAMYSELRFDGYRPPSFLETPGADLQPGQQLMRGPKARLDLQCLVQPRPAFLLQPTLPEVARLDDVRDQ